MSLRQMVRRFRDADFRTADFRTADFRAGEGGNAVIETVVILPTLLLAWIGVFVFWEAFSSRSMVQKAGFVAADVLSREMVPVTDAFLDGLDASMEYLVDNRFDVASRFTSFTRTGANDTDVAVVWSYSPAGVMTAMTNADLVAQAAQLPKLTVGSTALIVDTRMNYSLPVSLPLASYAVPSSFSDSIVLRPRFLAKLCRSGTAC